MNKKLVFVFVITFLSNSYCYIADSSYLIENDNQIDTIIKGALIFECVPLPDDSINNFIIFNKGNKPKNFIISENLLPGRIKGQFKDWKSYLKNEILKGNIFGKKYNEYKINFYGVYLDYPEDSTWFRNGYSYCELNGRFEQNNGEISTVLILKDGKIEFIWEYNKIPNSLFLKIKKGYVYYRRNSIVPRSVVNNLESLILSEKGIGSPSIQK